MATGIGLAALAVLVLILLAAQSTKRPPVAGASATPNPAESEFANPSAAETAAPCEPVGSDPEPPQPIAVRPFVAVALVDQLRVRSSAGLTGTVVDVLASGDVVWVTDGPTQADGSDWYPVQSDTETSGWVSAGPQDGPYLDLRTVHPVEEPAIVRGLAGGSPGFLAWGATAHRSDEIAPRFMAASANGVDWELAGTPTGMTDQIVSIGWGPAGWMAVTTDELNTAAGEFWSSRDGICWSRLPVFELPGVVPQSVVGSAAGYVLSARDDRTGTSRPNLFFSADGTAWDEVGAGGELSSAGVVAIETGFLIWATGDVGTKVWLSIDGQSWQDSAAGGLPPSLNNDPLFASTEEWHVAVTTEFNSGAQSIWRAPVRGGDLTWERQTDAESDLAGGSITSLVSDGGTILAVGYEPTRAAVRLWRTTDGATWTMVPSEGVFGDVVPEMIVAADVGFAAVGGTVTAAGTNPVLWHASDAMTWATAGQLVLGVVETPVVDACPVVPTTMVDWLTSPPSVAAACFGNASISFRGWLTDGEGCGGFFPGTSEPGWLASPYATSPIILSPFEVQYSGCGSAAPHPTLAALPESQQWVTITGHYNDPAAETCAWTPDPPYKLAVSQELMVLGCRQKFVADSVVPVAP